MKAQDSLASLGSRLVGQLLDDVVAIVIILPVVMRSYGDHLVSVLFVTGFAYLLLSDALPGGQSLGKRLMGIAVVDQRTGNACTVLQSLARNAPLLFLGLIDWVFIFGEKRQRLGDKLAGTVVVNAK